jgi:hypothetical protein
VDEARFACRSLHDQLHALSLLHRSFHWEASGPTGYGDHLLFERLYGPIPEEIDGLAERMVLVFGSRFLLDLVAVADTMHLYLETWGAAYRRTTATALRAEQGVLSSIAAARDALKVAGLLSTGLDNFLAGVADTHETHVYLLTQRLEGGRVAAEQAPSAEEHFFDSPRKRETAEFAESGALTNVPNVSSHAKYDNGKPKAERKRLDITPLTPEEVVHETPGSGEFSTLSRYVVQTEEPTDRGVPKSRDQAPKHPDIK